MTYGLFVDSGHKEEEPSPLSVSCGPIIRDRMTLPIAPLTPGHFWQAVLH